MSSNSRLRFVSAALVLSAASGVLARTDQIAGKAVQSEAAAQAAKASPELVGALSQELGSTPEQAAGAAGALFGIAKSRLAPAQFAQVAAAVPGMDALLKAAPAGAAAGTTGGMTKVAGLAGAATAFSSLGLPAEAVGKAVPVLTSFVTKSGGAEAGSLLAGVLK